MAQIAFEERAVAFIDVLGFTDLVTSAASDVNHLEQLQELVNLLESAVPDLNAGVAQTVPSELIPKHNYISDCIILTAPLEVSRPEWSHYRGLEILVMRVIQLVHRFLSAGYLLRGGIAVGKTWHSDGNILGPAYVEAYKLESSTEMPRIVLSQGAQARFPSGSRLAIAYGGTLMVNGLHDYYIPGSGGERIIKAFDHYASLVDQKLNSPLDHRALCKWLWFQRYMKAERENALKWARV